ncbi:site-specific DNA-methyltransferase [Lutispora sp.]|uniref:site-specific DNA-methyltransferase n=1 Tax=Lutispora sp. TaxID=2828727 RepID=UPI002B21B453|nr:DNA methyltransferase [Lutispora sp.]MEA4960961.1 DNA methyltransferase [Lutispora sp.]
MLSQEDVDVEREGYELRFLGKSYAKYLTSTATTTVITPDLEHNNKPENKDSENIYIVGDNLDAIKHLLKSYSGEIKCIYIDPPYNTGSDGFVYPDNFKFTKESLADAIGIEEDEAERILGMAGKSTHSAWLTFMYPRLMLARDLLSDDGVIFISIDDNEQANLKLICDDIFGEGNFVAPIIWQKKTGASDALGIASITEYILAYMKNISSVNSSFNKNKESYDLNRYKYQDEFYEKRGLYYIDNLDRGGLQYSDSLNFGIECPDGTITFPNGRTEYENDGWIWKWGKQKVEWAIKNKFIEFRKSNIKRSGWSVCYKNYLNVDNEDNLIERAAPYKNLVNHVLNANAAADMKALFGTTLFEYSKPVELMKYIIQLIDSDDAIILDFFSGSATAAHAVMELNANDANIEKNRGKRKYIMVQLPETIEKDKPAYKEGYYTIDEIGRARIDKAALKIKEETGADIDYGYKLYRLSQPSDKTLDKIVAFDPHEILILEDMTQSFEFGDVPGRYTILTTWMNMDGYGLTSKAGKIRLHQYEAYVIYDSLYIIDPGLATDDVMEMIKKVEDGSLNISRIVLYPYSIIFNVLHELKKNIANLRNNRNIVVVERY